MEDSDEDTDFENWNGNNDLEDQDEVNELEYSNEDNQLEDPDEDKTLEKLVDDESIAIVQQSIATEDINALTSNLRLDHFNLTDLKEGVVLCRLASLENLEKALVDEILIGSRIFQFQTPIPHGKRPLCTRTSALFSFYHQFCDVASLTSKDSPAHKVHSPWFRDPLTQYRWRIRVYFRGNLETSRDKFVSLFLEKERDEKSEETENTNEETSYALFTISSTEHSATKFRLGECDFGLSAWGLDKFALTQYVVEESGKNLDTILFGATIFK